MPSWPARLLSIPATSPPRSNTTGGSPSRSDIRSPPSETGRPYDSVIRPSSRPDELLAMPTLHPPPRLNESTTWTGQRPRHGRSFSNPFPSLFGSSRKGAHTGVDDLTSSDSTDNENGVETSGPVGLPQLNKAKGPRGGEKDLITGRCMTCDSSVRWPRDLKVFRCSICQTINDLVPVNSETRGPTGAANATNFRGTAPQGETSSTKVSPLSAGRTKSIIDRCITSYLQSRRQLHSLQRTETIPSPPQSPTNARFQEALPTDQPSSIPTLDTTRQPPHPSISISPTSRPSSPLGPQHQPDWTFPNTNADLSPLQYSASLPLSAFSTLDPTQRREHPFIGPKAPSRNPPIPPSEWPRQHTYSRSASGLERRPSPRVPSHERPARQFGQEQPSERREARATSVEPLRRIFKPLESYLVSCFGSHECINSSFTTFRPGPSGRTMSEDVTTSAKNGGNERWIPQLHIPPLSDVDAKTLLIGDVAENGSWWTGGRSSSRAKGRLPLHRRDKSAGVDISHDTVSMKTPRVDWIQLGLWYQTVLRAGSDWKARWHELAGDSRSNRPDSDDESEEDQKVFLEIEEDFAAARMRLQRTLLKASESLLKRPGRPLREPEDLRFLFILLANPLLYPHSSTAGEADSSARTLTHSGTPMSEMSPLKRVPKSSERDRTGPGQHSAIIKRILGLMASLPNDSHKYLVAWFSRFSDSHFERLVDLVGSFVTYRLTRQHGQKKPTPADPTAGLVPNLNAPGTGSSAQLHAALGISGTSKPAEATSKGVVYSEDWQIIVAARVMALLFLANSSGNGRRMESAITLTPDVGQSGEGWASRMRSHNHSRLLPLSSFYNTLLDYSELIADFEAWEYRRGKFAFCQYPFFLSIWAKIHILEYDAKRQMESKAREAFFDSIISRKAISQYLVLKVRRECLVEDSLRGVSEVVGSGQEDIKKSLRIEFLGEEGIDGGGLRKEWFLLLVRDVFDPLHGLFVYDDDSQLCYFNPHCFETSDQFFLVGVLLGLAIYNSTILDVALPLVTFKKLLSAAPGASVSAPPTASAPRSPLTYTLEDLADFRPSLARGLKQLLEFEGNVQETFCQDFVADIDRYGQVTRVPLCAGGESKPVTNANRREFVELYVHYLLDTSVIRQFEPFKRGFYTVCGGNALSLFRPEEIELLVRGSEDSLDISSLRAVAVHDGWGSRNAEYTEPCVSWFWELFAEAEAKEQRKLLGFITGSDRLPAMGATHLIIKLSCLGEDCERFPVARTCFNQLGLWKYATKEKLSSKLWRAVDESAGFGLK